MVVVLIVAVRMAMTMATTMAILHNCAQFCTNVPQGNIPRHFLPPFWPNSRRTRPRSLTVHRRLVAPPGENLTPNRGSHRKKKNTRTALFGLLSNADMCTISESSKAWTTRAVAPSKQSEQLHKECNGVQPAGAAVDFMWLIACWIFPGN